MVYVFTAQEILDFEALLSPARFTTYLNARNGNKHKALELYIWNTQLSAALYELLQFCELAVRNAAVEAIEIEFGANWHHSRGFTYTLPISKGRYKPRADLVNCASALPTAGKVVAELKFVFWQYLFVKSHDARLWKTYFSTVFPAYDHSKSVEAARSEIYNDLDIIRKLRNRIAHHEPIFNRTLTEDRDRILKLISWRRPSTAAWLGTFETVSTLLANRPA